MSWTPDQLTQHPKFKKLLGVNTKLKQPSITKERQPPAKAETGNFDYSLSDAFTVPGDPMGKPRQTQRDRWQKRDCVLRYRDYCDRIRAAAPARLATVDVYAIGVIAYFAMPDSWSKKKKALMNGIMHRVKPDHDNVQKGILDGLLKDDSGVGRGGCEKIWCVAGQQRMEITVWFLENPVLT